LLQMKLQGQEVGWVEATQGFEWMAHKAGRQAVYFGICLEFFLRKFKKQCVCGKGENI
jgi:hypothetical protein